VAEHWDTSIEPGDQQSAENAESDQGPEISEKKQELVCKEEIEEVVFD
jgi:hypothetical protein